MRCARWSLCGAFLTGRWLCCGGARSPNEAVEQVVSALESLELPRDARELDRLMVALLWNLPLFVEHQKERVLENGGDELLYQRLRGRTFEEVERLLGLGHVDHDVGQWFGNEP